MFKYLRYTAKECKNKLVELLGEQQEKTIEDAISVDKMDFKRKYVTEEEAKIIDKLKEQFGFPKEVNRFRSWIINQETNDFLVKIGGNGYHDKQNPGVFIYSTSVGITKIEANYTVAGRALDGCGAYWNITKIEAPIAYKNERDNLLNSINMVFRCYGIGFDPAIIDVFELKFLCDPKFV